jgi:hypothetical protein
MREGTRFQPSGIPGTSAARRAGDLDAFHCCRWTVPTSFPGADRRGGRDGSDQDRAAWPMRNERRRPPRASQGAHVQEPRPMSTIYGVETRWSGRRDLRQPPTGLARGPRGAVGCEPRVARCLRAHRWTQPNPHAHQVPEIETERLRLRPLDVGDLDAWHRQIFSDPQVTRYLPVRRPIPREDVVERLRLRLRVGRSVVWRVGGSPEGFVPAHGSFRVRHARSVRSHRADLRAGSRLVRKRIRDRGRGRLSPPWFRGPELHGDRGTCVSGE